MPNVVAPTSSVLPPPPPTAEALETAEMKRLHKEPRKEEETDSPEDTRQKLKDAVTFLVPDTTLNVMKSAFGETLMALTQDGIQYLFAGARANVGIKSGRYYFEVKILECLHTQDASGGNRTPHPKMLLRVGFGLNGSMPMAGESEDNVCFDSEGNHQFNRRRNAVSDRSYPGTVLGVLLNLSEEGPCAQSMSLYKDGVRVSDPVKLPDNLKGKTLYPMVTFRCMSVHVNFGPDLMAPLEYKVRSVQEAAEEDVVVTKYPAPKDGKHEVLFPVCLPDQGTFDWLEMFLEKNPHYTEISDRVLVDWALKSGIWKNPQNKGEKGEGKGKSEGKSSNDKPEIQFGIPTIDNGEVKKLLWSVSTVHKRDVVIMEVKDNLIKPIRQLAVKQWNLPTHRRVAQVMMGEPDKDYKEKVYGRILREKQAKLAIEFEVEKNQRRRQRDAERAKRNIEREQQRQERESKRKAEAEAGADEDPAVKAEWDRVEAEAKEAEEKEIVAEQAVDAEEDARKPPEAKLTPEELRDWYRKPSGSNNLPDLQERVMNICFSNFSLPQTEEGFDEVRHTWQSAEKSGEHMRAWVLERKQTTRLEELQPSDWFRERWARWQRDLQGWHHTSLELKDPDKKAKAIAAKLEAKGEEKKGDEENKPDNNQDDDNIDPMKALEEEIEKQDLDIFGVEDVDDIGTGEPMFMGFGFEDWALMTLRFELHLLVHSFVKDANDPDRKGITLDNLVFYYGKYYKKPLNWKNYGVDAIEEMLALVQDTVVVCDKVIESQIMNDLETNEVFVKLAEEDRRVRQLKIDGGDESAKIKLGVGFTAASIGLFTGPPGPPPGVPPPGGNMGGCMQGGIGGCMQGGMGGGMMGAAAKSVGMPMPGGMHGGMPGGGMDGCFAGKGDGKSFQPQMQQQFQGQQFGQGQMQGQMVPPRPGFNQQQMGQQPCGGGGFGGDKGFGNKGGFDGNKGGFGGDKGGFGNKGGFDGNKGGMCGDKGGFGGKGGGFDGNKGGMCGDKGGFGGKGGPQFDGNKGGGFGGKGGPQFDGNKGGGMCGGCPQQGGMCVPPMQGGMAQGMSGPMGGQMGGNMGKGGCMQGGGMCGGGCMQGGCMQGGNMGGKGGCMGGGMCGGGCMGGGMCGGGCMGGGMCGGGCMGGGMCGGGMCNMGGKGGPQGCGGCQGDYGKAGKGFPQQGGMGGGCGKGPY